MAYNDSLKVESLLLLFLSHRYNMNERIALSLSQDNCTCLELKTI